MAHIARWTGPTQYEDGSAFGQEDLAGFQISLDGSPAVNVPFDWNDDNRYEFDLRQLGLEYGDHTVAVATVAKNGKVSDFTPAIPFNYADERVPNAPLDLSVVGESES